MSFANDDLTSILVPPLGRALSYSQARILTWNPADNTGTLDWRGVTLTNVPVLSGIQALGFEAGHVVGLVGWESGGGAGSWWIIGRILIPGVDSPNLVVRGSDIIIDGGRLVLRGGDDLVVEDGGDVVIADTGDLLVEDGGDQVSLRTIAFGLEADEAGGFVSTSSSSYTSLSGGPSVSVDVGNSGRMLVTVSARITPASYDSGTGSAYSNAYMGFEVAGASSRSPSDSDAIRVSGVVSSDFPISPVRFAASKQVVVTGLNPGTHTVSARYRRDHSGGGGGFSVDSASFQDRTIAVQPY